MISSDELIPTYQKCKAAVDGALLSGKAEINQGIALAWQLVNDPRLSSVLRDNLRAGLERLKEQGEGKATTIEVEVV